MNFTYNTDQSFCLQGNAEFFKLYVSSLDNWELLVLVQNHESAECTVMCAVVFDIDKLLQLQTDYENIKNVPGLFMFYKIQFLYKNASCNPTCINLYQPVLSATSLLWPDRLKSCLLFRQADFQKKITCMSSEHILICRHCHY